MEAIGIVRRIDRLGRVVLPVEWRRQLQMETETPVEILAEGQQLIVRRCIPGCVVCGSCNVIGATRICTRCREELIGTAAGANRPEPGGR